MLIVWNDVACFEREAQTRGDGISKNHERGGLEGQMLRLFLIAKNLVNYAFVWKK